MRDYEAILKQARTCAQRKYCDIGGNCEYYAADVCCQGGEKDVLYDAADAIEELLGQHEADAKEIAWLKKCVQDLPKPPRWISVEERLPAKYDSVITADKHGNVRFNYLISEKYGTWSTGYHISHWMPLPEPPKEVE